MDPYTTVDSRLQPSRNKALNQSVDNIQQARTYLTSPENQDGDGHYRKKSLLMNQSNYKGTLNDSATNSPYLAEKIGIGERLGSGIGNNPLR